MSDAPILVTGCSSGIGRATAVRLARSGRTVYATARSLAAIADLESRGCRLLRLDVTDEVSMAAAVGEVESAHGAVGVLVNNAGYGEYGVIEEVPIERVRRQFETNVFGLARMCQLVLPAMRVAGAGRIVNVSSMGGRLVFPGGGYYHATKHAVEAISDALRPELRPFGIAVIVVEPGMIRTEFGAVALHTLDRTAETRGPYDAMNAAVGRGIERSYANRLLSAGPDAVAAAIGRAIAARRPRTRYVVTPAARALIAARAWLPDRAWDAFIRRQFRLPS
jgi:NAD(P)-dependent dehydrogenase (short-subunit alcohol dehydrogenase family)